MENTLKHNNYPEYRKPALQLICPECGLLFEARGLIAHRRMTHHLKDIEILPKALKLPEGTISLGMLQKYLGHPKIKFKMGEDNKIKALKLEGNLEDPLLNNAIPNKVEYYDEVAPNYNDEIKAKLLYDLQKEITNDSFHERLKPLTVWGIELLKELQSESRNNLYNIKKQIKSYFELKEDVNALLIDPHIYDFFGRHLYGSYYESKIKAKELLGL